MTIRALFELFDGNTICRLVVNGEYRHLRSLLNAKMLYPEVIIVGLSISVENGLPIVNIYVEEE